EAAGAMGAGGARVGRGGHGATGRGPEDGGRGGAPPAAARLARKMQEALAAVWGKDRDRGVKQAPMDVLMGHTAPAVLVEVGFIDHPIEGTDLLRHDVREKIADAIAKAILDFLKP